MKVDLYAPDLKIFEALGKIMGAINRMLNNDKDSSDPKLLWKENAQTIIDVVNPVLILFRDEVRKELGLEVPKQHRGDPWR